MTNADYCFAVIKQIIVVFGCDDVILWSEHEDGRVYAFVNCSDLFVWACADGEEILAEDIPDVVQAFVDDEDNGGLLWCCRKRGMRPQGPYYKYLKKNSALFDACGPIRPMPNE
mgnify:CR=1 FL=1